MNNSNLRGIWDDSDGEYIQAHGGCIIYAEKKYYWYGENKDSDTIIVPFIPAWKSDHNPNEKSYRHRTDLIGVSCYSSIDLKEWHNEGIVLQTTKDDYKHDLYFKNVLERPKVIYNEKTKKYVMWFHVDTPDYQYARAGVATSDSPTGPFKYHGSMRPNNQMSRDITVFKDDDGQAYIIFSSEQNSTMHVAQLSDDYLRTTGTYTRNFINQYREAPAIFKHNQYYYLITSGCTGWEPNEAEYAVTNNILGEWTRMGNPFRGENSHTTFSSQGTYILKIEKQKNGYLFMADKWNKEDLRKSQYMWLKFEVNDEEIEIQGQDD